LNSVFRIDEGGKFFSKVDCFVYCNHCSIIFLFVKKISKCWDYSLASHFSAFAETKHFSVLRQFREEAVKSLDCSGSEDLIQNLDFMNQLVCYFFKTFRKLSYVCQCNNQILSEIWILIGFKTVNDRCNNEWIALSIDLYDLVFSFEVDGASHQD